MTAVVDRRTTLAWFVAAAGAPALAGCGSGGWRDLRPAEITATGYGSDPKVTEPSTPWPLTLTAAEKSTLTPLTEAILPGAAAAGVSAFIDEWVSAPYPRQQEDRALILSGLAWIEAESRRRFDRPFPNTSAKDRDALFGDLTDPTKAAKTLKSPARFFSKVRDLTVAAYFTTEAGAQELGYRGGTPIRGDYPGPTPEALDHLRRGLAQRGLRLPA